MIKVDNLFLRAKLHRKIKPTAKKLGIHHATLGKKIEGSSEWTIDELNRLSHAIGISTDQFVTVDEDLPAIEDKIEKAA